ncbi:MAG: replication-associated recombination protein A [Thiotrichales bacterium]
MSLAHRSDSPATVNPVRPLADRVRPQKIEDISGQGHLLAPGRPLHEALKQGHLHSMVFWGPPGCGKTTLAQLLADLGHAHFEQLSAVLAGVKEIRAVVEAARQRLRDSGAPTLLFVDEVHRFNKAQQDAFLPHIEDGSIVFVGATTENPSFELNNALLSRVRTYVLKPLSREALKQLVLSALSDPRAGFTQSVRLGEDALDALVEFADGDARRALNLLELAVDLGEAGADAVEVTLATVASLAGERMRRFDNGGEAFYDQISAMHKSVRGSSPDGALYWLCRMLDGGADPRYLARRVIRMACEDIGNADPRALRLALDAAEVYERLGSPEGELALAQAVIYLACAAKSNAVYTAYNAARERVAHSGSLEVPVHLRNAPTRLMRELGYGKAYRYAHDEPDAYAAGERYLPDAFGDVVFYHPVGRGLETRIRDKLAELKARDVAARRAREPD